MFNSGKNSFWSTLILVKAPFSGRKLLESLIWCDANFNGFIFESDNSFIEILSLVSENKSFSHRRSFKIAQIRNQGRTYGCHCVKAENKTQ